MPAERPGRGGAPPRAVIFGCAGPTLSDAEKAFFAKADPLGFIRAATDEFIGMMLNDASFRRVFEIFWHKCEYVGEMANLRDSHLEEGENHIDILQRAFALAQEKGLMNRLLTPHQATIGLIGQVDGLLFNWTKNPDMFPLASYAPCILDAWFRGLTAPVDAA